MSERREAGAGTQSQPAKSMDETSGGPNRQEHSVSEMEGEEKDKRTRGYVKSQNVGFHIHMGCCHTAIPDFCVDAGHPKASKFRSSDLCNKHFSY